MPTDVGIFIGASLNVKSLFYFNAKGAFTSHVQISNDKFKHCL